MITLSREYLVEVDLTPAAIIANGTSQPLEGIANSMGKRTSGNAASDPLRNEMAQIELMVTQLMHIMQGTANLAACAAETCSSDSRLFKPETGIA